MPARNTTHKLFVLQKEFADPQGIEPLLWELLGDVLRDIEGCHYSEVITQDTEASVPLPPLPPARHRETLLVELTSDTWSRAARRKRRMAISPQSSELVHADTPSSYSMSCLMGWHVPLMHQARSQPAVTCELECTWARGRDRMLFESFWNHMSRKASDAILSQNRRIATGS
jgi:hypothetical protein